MNVPCSIEYVVLENEDGREVDGVMATCSRCDQIEESLGTMERSLRRCLALLRDDCPRRELNFYMPE